MGLVRDTALGQDYAAIRGAPAMYMIYAAFGTKKGWFGKTRLGTIAERTRKVDPLEFGRLRASPEQFVDYAVSEAERIAKLHGITVELALYCHIAYVRKYLQQQNSTHL